MRRRGGVTMSDIISLQKDVIPDHSSPGDGGAPCHEYTCSSHQGTKSGMSRLTRSG